MIIKYSRKSLFYLLFIINAAITPGIQPKQVKINTNKIDPHPLSITAKGGKMILNRTLQIDINL